MKETKVSKYIFIAIIFIVLGFLIVSSSLIIKPSINGVVVDEITNSQGVDELIYLGQGQMAVKIFAISALVLSSVLLVVVIGNQLIEVFNLFDDKKEKIVFGLLLAEIILSIVLIFINTFNLFTFPVGLDDFNNFAWALSLAAILILIAILTRSVYTLIIKKKPNLGSTKMSVQVLTEGSIMVALSVILSVLGDMMPGFKLPYGGSFSLSMLPLFIFALRNGALHGALVGFTYSIVNFLVDGAIIYHWGSVFFDYLIPYTILGFVAGLFMKKANRGRIGFTVIAVLLGGFVRYLSHGFSGAVFFGQWAPEGMTAFYYSFIAYNLPYMAVNTGVALVIILLVHQRLITKDSRVV